MPFMQQRTGALLVLASAVAFGVMPVFGKLSFEAGVGVATLLFVRFAIATPVLWAAVRRPRRAARAGRGPVLRALALGAVGYAMQAGLYFLALERMDASVLSLILYSYPALVTGAAILLRRESASRRRLVALRHRVRAASCWCSRAPASGAWTWRAARSAPAPRSPTRPTSSCPTA